MIRSAGFAVVSLGSVALLAATVTTASASDGKAAYDANCASCHGEDGRADTPVGKAMKAASLVDPAWVSEDSLDAFVKAFRENAKHKSVGAKVDDEQLTAIAAHVRELAKAGAE